MAASTLTKRLGPLLRLYSLTRAKKAAALFPEWDREAGEAVRNYRGSLGKESADPIEVDDWSRTKGNRGRMAGVRSEWDRDTHIDKVRKMIAAGNAARERKEWKTAAAAFHQVLQARPDFVAIWVQCGNMLKEDRQLEESEAAYLEALRLAPDDADIHLMYGHLLKISNRLDEAATHYHKSALLDAARPDARMELMNLAERGVSRAQIRLPPAGSNSRTWSLNAKLAATRTHISEIMAELRKIEQRRPSAGRCAEGEYMRILAAAYESITPLMRSLNNPRASNWVSGAPVAARSPTQKIKVVFDTSDLIQYFRHHRLPTGIQRVQMETIYAALANPDPMVDISVCCFTEAHDYWREILPADFMNLCELSLLGNDWTASDWREAMSELDGKLGTSPNFVFSDNAFLVNMGTSWWLQNYFLCVREAKRQQKIKYVPFVHDMIPIMTPEHCVAGLTQDFISWVLGVFAHADFYLVNSEATRKDLRRVGATLGYGVEDNLIHTVRLDADFRKGQEFQFDPTVLLTHRLKRDGYVLFVSTIEARKNHLAAFDAWLALCKKHGVERVPKLVCVGSRGWLNDPVFARLGSSEVLAEKVVMLSGVSDRELALLYESCLFTLFPSAYEGWGLPVTESLCYGKATVISNSSSLPEAGEEFADYFELGNQNQLVEALERLIFDAQYRRSREALIREKYRPRSWEDVSNDIIGALERLQHADAPVSQGDSLVPVVTLGRYYGLHRNTEVKIYSSMASGEVFRTGDAWWGCEDWGCWTKPRPARMALRIPERDGAYRLYLGLRSAPNIDTPYDVTVTNCSTVRGVVKSQKSKWLWFDLEINDAAESLVQVVLQGYATGSARPRPEENERVVALGVVGFMVCRQDDTAARTNLIEAIALESLDQLTKCSSTIGQ